MSFLGGIVGSIFGGGGGGSTSTSSQSTTNQTDINIDLKPLGEILADSQIKSASIAESSSLQSASIASNGLIQSANTAKEAQQIGFLSDERNRVLDVEKQKKLDTYLEHAKNGLVTILIIGGLLYVSKNKKGGK